MFVKTGLVRLFLYREEELLSQGGGGGGGWVGTPLFGLKGYVRANPPRQSTPESLLAD